MKQTITYAEKRFFEWHEDDLSVTLRGMSGSYGGGSEVLVVQRRFSDVIVNDTEIAPTIEVGGEVLVLYSNQNNAQAVDTEISPTLTASMGLGGAMSL